MRRICSMLGAAMIYAGFSLQAQTAESPVINAQTTDSPVISVTLLGTGVPLIDPLAYIATGRFTSSLLVKAGGDKFLFDCGQGALTRLLQSGGPATDPNANVDKVFISHLHSDHIADLASFFTANLVKFAKNADMLIIEAWGFPPSAGPDLFAYHCPPESCISPTLTQANVRMGVLTHIATPTTTDDLVTRIRNAGYQGPLTVGADLMQLDINTDGTIKVTRPPLRSIEKEGFLPAEMRSIDPPLRPAGPR